MNIDQEIRAAALQATAILLAPQVDGNVRPQWTPDDVKRLADQFVAYIRGEGVELVKEDHGIYCDCRGCSWVRSVLP